MKSIALVMIVKDESKVIRRCLESVRGFIDGWLIVDTGSKDDTKNIIKETLKDIPGELRDRPWVNFGHNRSEALEIARELRIADYSLILDADDMFMSDKPIENLYHDAYHIEIESGCIIFDQLRLFSNDVDWKYVGALHEYPSCDHPTLLGGKLEGVKIISQHDGHGWGNPNKYRRHALILEGELLDDPKNTRSVFYLAQSYRDCGDIDAAIKNYEKRITMDGWYEEKWYAMYQLGCLYDRKGERAKAIKSYLDAYNFNPQRAEPLYELCRLYRLEGKFFLGYTFGKMALSIPVPTRGLFVTKDAYDKCLYDELSICAYYVGKYIESMDLCEMALKSGHPDKHRIINNKQFALKAMKCPVDTENMGFDFFNSHAFPHFLQFETNTLCNAHCKMCPHDIMESRPQISEMLMDKIISECVPMVESVCPFMFQEPALDDYLVRTLKRIKEANPKVHTTIYSNMESMSPRISEDIIDSGCLDSLCVSFYGPTRELYSEWQPYLWWWRTKRNIRHFINYKTEKNAHTSVNFHYLAHPDLLPFYDDFKEEWYDADSIGLVHYDTFCGLLDEIDDDAIWGKRAEKRTPCPRLWSEFNVHSNGHVVPCCLDFSEEIVLGDLNEQSPQEIWRGKKFEELRKMHVEGRFNEIPLCEDCNVWHHRHSKEWQSMWL